MSIQRMKEYVLGDMTVRYVTDEEKKSVGLLLFPSDLPLNDLPCRNEKIDSLIQLKLCGDIYDEAYAMGSSMRNAETVRRLVYKRQEHEAKEQTEEIRTYLASGDGRYQAVHHLLWKKGTPYVRIFCSDDQTNRRRGKRREKQGKCPIICQNSDKKCRKSGLLWHTPQKNRISKPQAAQ